MSPPRDTSFVREATEQTRDLDFRVLTVRASTIDEKTRSVEAVIASEASVPMFDQNRWEMVPEVLLMSGCRMPDSGQMPFLKDHNRWSTDDMLGSARQMRTEKDELIGRLFFSETAADTFTKVREGHLTDVSVGYRVTKRVFVPTGTTQKIAGRKFEGPVNVVTDWSPREVSAVPIGADESAKLRGYDPTKPKPTNSPSSKGFRMDPELKTALIDRGMPANLDDAAAQRWQVEDLKARAKKKADKKAAKEAARAEIGGKTSGKKKDKKADKERGDKKWTPERMAELIEQGAEKALKAREDKELAHRAEVVALCEIAGVSDPARFAGMPLSDARKAIIETRQKQAATIGFSGANFEGGAEQIDKHRGAVQTAFELRTLGNACGHSPTILERELPVAKRAAGWEQFKHLSMTEIGRQCLQMDGFDVRGLTNEQICIAAMGWPYQAGIRGERALYPAYHTTGSFSKITQDAINKSMQVGYTEYNPTWRQCFRQGISVPDFKTIHRMRLGAVPNAPAWPDNTDPQQVSFADADETYAVEAFSEQFSYSYRLMVNDDMDALSRMPFLFGTALARTVNAAAWAQITGNPTLGADSQALFCSATTGNRLQVNSFTGVAPPTTANLQPMYNALMQMRGENTPENVKGPDILNLMPKFIVGPTALYTAIMQLVKSPYDPSQTTAQFQEFNTANILTPIIEPLLDANSLVAYYVMASPQQIDNVEVTFLQGQETPVMRDWVDEQVLSHSWAVLQTFAAKALQWRGMIKQVGA